MNILKIQYEALIDADALIIVHGMAGIQVPNFNIIEKLMKRKLFSMAEIFMNLQK